MITNVMIVVNLITHPSLEGVPRAPPVPHPSLEGYLNGGGRIRTVMMVVLVVLAVPVVLTLRILLVLLDLRLVRILRIGVVVENELSFHFVMIVTILTSGADFDLYPA